jgi:lysophospholipid acyltransferase (LPLAT)-like uncharacterized protein
VNSGSWRIAVGSRLIHLLFMVLRWTWKIHEDPWPEAVRKRLDQRQPVAFAHFHEDEWALIGAYSGRRMGVLVSLSQDGSLMAQFLKLLGFEVLRGSSSKGGAAGLLSLLRFARNSSYPIVSLAVDGPRGPRREVKAGITGLSEILSSPVCCGAAFASRAWVFRKAWNRAFLPKPFAKVRICYALCDSGDAGQVRLSLEKAKNLACTNLD